MPQEKPVVQKMYDLIKWLIPQIAKLPRSHKFTLGDRITNLALDTLELLIQAVYIRRKLELLQKANLNLERLRFLARFSVNVSPLRDDATDDATDDAIGYCRSGTPPCCHF